MTDARPKDTPWVAPYLTVKSAEAAMEFYEEVFGFAPHFARKGKDGRVEHGELTYHDQLLFIAPVGAPGGAKETPAMSGTESPVSLFVYFDDVDALVARASQAGAKVLMPPQDMFWGDRIAKLVDPDGHVWIAAQHVKDLSPEEMQEAQAQ